MMVELMLFTTGCGMTKMCFYNTEQIEARNAQQQHRERRTLRLERNALPSMSFCVSTPCRSRQAMPCRSLNISSICDAARPVRENRQESIPQTKQRELTSSWDHTSGVRNVSRTSAPHSSVVRTAERGRTSVNAHVAHSAQRHAHLARLLR